MRIILIGALIALLPSGVAARDNVDLPGNDYRNFSAPSANLCRNSCAGDLKCKAWTWVKASKTCFLKDPLPQMVRNNCCSGGAREGIEEADLKPEVGIDRPGQNFRDFDANLGDCQRACARENACAVWVWAKPGVHGRNAHCWLKDGVPAPVLDANATSGVKLRRRLD